MISFIRNLVGLLSVSLIRSCSIASFRVSSQALRLACKVVVLHDTRIDSTSSIGSYTYIGSNVDIGRSDVGRYCSIANNVSIGQGEHRLDLISTSSMFYDDPWETLTKLDCVVESDVWIGVDAVVLRGVKVGIGAVIAANAVVTKDVPAFAIVAGVPAKLVRYRFPENIQNLIIESRWWEKEYIEALNVIKQIEKKLGESV